MRGVTVKELQELLGHSSLVMTMRYAHLAPEHLRTAVSRLEGLTNTEPAKDSAQEPVPTVGGASEVLAVVGSPGRARTCDILINSQALYRLSYRGVTRDSSYTELETGVSISNAGCAGRRPGRAGGLGAGVGAPRIEHQARPDRRRGIVTGAPIWDRSRRQRHSFTSRATRVAM